MERNLALIQKIANESLTYNKDINQHIESCRISLDIINQKEETIQILRNMITTRDEEIRKSEEENLRLSKEKFIIEACRDISISELKEVLAEQYRIIDELITKYKNLEEFIASNNKFLDDLISKVNHGQS